MKNTSNSTRKLTPSRLQAYIKCPRQMYMEAGFPKKEGNPTVLEVAVNYKGILNRVCEAWFKRAGKEFTPMLTLSTAEKSCKVDYVVEGSASIELFHVVSSVMDDISEVFTKKGEPKYEFKQYFIRAALCHKIAKEIYKDKTVESHFLMLDGTKPMPVAGIEFDQFATGVWGISGQVNPELADAIKDLNITETCERYISGEIHPAYKKTLASVVSEAEYVLKAHSEPPCNITHVCANCMAKDHCMKEKYSDYGTDKTLWEINNLNYKIKNQILGGNHYKMADIPDDVLTERQQIQKEKTLTQDRAPWFNKEAFKKMTADWKYPLHCLDFETAVFPVGVFANTLPMAGVIYQYSDHEIDENGHIVKHSEYVSLEKGVNPTIALVRHLKDTLSKDNGTVVVYSQHENTYLSFAYEQILREQPEDAKELLSFVRSIITPGDEMLARTGEEPWTPVRPLGDLLEVVKASFYQKDMGGSNSIKQVLPAILASVSEVQDEWKDGYSGTNLHNQCVISLNIDGSAVSPYDMLPKFPGVELHKGDQALELYGEVMLAKCSPERLAAIKQAMLAYCEMDTLAEVLVLQGLFALSKE